MPYNYVSSLVQTDGTISGAAYSPPASIGTDSYNGPLGTNVSNPLTDAQINAVVIDSAALGLLGGSKAAAADYMSSPTNASANFQVKWLNTNLTYDATFYGAFRYATEATKISAYSDGTYTTQVASTTLNVGGSGSYNQNTVASLTGLKTAATGSQLSFQFGTASGTSSGYLNSMELYGYLGYLDGGTTTLSAASPYVVIGTYPNSDPRSADTGIGNGTTLNVNDASGIYWNSTLVMRAGGGTINAGANFSAYALTGSGNLTVGGASTFSITHAGTYSGTLNLSGGSLSLTAAGALGTGNLTLNGGTLSVGNATALGTGAFTVASGTTTLNNYNALTALTGNNAINLNGGSAIFQVNGYGQILNLGTGNVTVAGTNSLNAWAGGMRFDGVISGSGTLDWYGGGTLTLGGANTFTGTVYPSGNNGTLSLANVNALQNATLNMGANQTLAFGVAGTNTYNVGALTGSNAAAAIDLGANTINAGSSNATTTYAGSIAGSTGGGLTKSGSGSLTLSGTNTYTGTTTIAAGTLILAAGGDIASSSGVNLGTAGSQGTLDLTAKSGYTFASGVTVNGYGTIDIGAGKTVTIAGNYQPGNSPGQVNVTGNLALSSTAATTMELAGNGGVKGTDFDNSTSTGTTTYGGTLSIVSFGGYDINANHGVTYSLFDFAAYAGDFTSVAVAGTSLSESGTLWTGTNGGTFYSFDLATGGLRVVPEPATWALLAFSLTTVMVLRRRRG